MAKKYYRDLQEAVKKNGTYLFLEGDFDTFPEELFKLTKVKELYFSGKTTFEELPPQIGKLKSLTHLAIRSGQLKTIPPQIGQLSRLTHLKLDENQIESLPKEIGDLQSLKFLLLNDNQLSSLPESISKLSNLQELNVKNNKLSRFIRTMNPMREMRNLNLLGNPLEKFPSAIFSAPLQFDLNIDSKLVGSLHTRSASYRERPPLWEFIKRCQTLNISKTATQNYFALAANKRNLIAELDRKTLIEALTSRIRQVVSVALTELTKDIPATPDFTKEHNVWLLAKTAQKKTEIRDRLKKLGVGYSAKYSDKVSHVVIAESMKKTENLIENKGLKLMTEAQLMQFLDRLDPPYIVDKKSGVDASQVSDLILSGLDENMGVALELLTGGGVPQDMVTELFIVNRLSENPKFRSKAKKLLGQKASAKLQELMKKRKPLNEKFYWGTKVHRNIDFYAKQTELDASKIALAIYRKHGCGASYVLSYANAERKRAILEEMIKNEEFILGTGEWLCKFPEEILEFKDRIRRMRISCQVGDGFTDKEILEGFGGLENMEEFTITCSNFHTSRIYSELSFLKNFKKLKKLSVKSRDGDKEKKALRMFIPKDCELKIV